MSFPLSSTSSDVQHWIRDEQFDEKTIEIFAKCDVETSMKMLETETVLMEMLPNNDGNKFSSLLKAVRNSPSELLIHSLAVFDNASTFYASKLNT